MVGKAIPLPIFLKSKEFLIAKGFDFAFFPNSYKTKICFNSEHFFAHLGKCLSLLVYFDKLKDFASFGKKDGLTLTYPIFTEGP